MKSQKNNTRDERKIAFTFSYIDLENDIIIYEDEESSVII